ncbi:M23 family metallopeptidase [Flavobacterium sp. RHBU_24]|uniref:M23 family metallopeptidase n=1 Tax=Flavobacterium sp. RHBU_24 TaxID=3391185 RepID=UPI003984D2D5
MKNTKSWLYTVLFILTISCSVPRKEYFQAQTATTVNVLNDTIHFKLNNPLKSPIRYFITSTDSAFNAKIKRYHQVVLQPETDSLVHIAADSLLVKTIVLNTMLGDPRKQAKQTTLELPFAKGAAYNVIQAYDGSYSHNEKYSKYAIDFALKAGDTVCAADGGVVVGVIKEYKHGGAHKKWAGYANYITLYHPHSGLYTQYVHLKYNGVLVKIGDTVTRGQSIGLSGKTGWTDVAHLHFNALIAVPRGLVSVPVKFTGGIEGAALKEGNVVKKE